MPKIMAKMTAAALFETTETALAIAGLPSFNSADADGQVEELKFLPAAVDGDEDSWALVPLDSDPEEYVAVDTVMAMFVLMSYFREWLLARGFQLQVHCHANLQRWTLVDCLSPVDGGGDRLDVDYPYGDDQLIVLAQSVLAVNTLS